MFHQLPLTQHLGEFLKLWMQGRIEDLVYFQVGSEIFLIQNSVSYCNDRWAPELVYRLSELTIHLMSTCHFA